MYGLVFEMAEEWVIEQQGLEIWHAIKQKARCDVQDNAFLRRSYYPDEALIDIVVAASEVLSIEVPVLLEAFGHFVIRHHYANGYDDLLRCQGSTLRQWLSNLNAMHDHLQKTFEDEEKFQAPIFWCENCDSVEGSILLHYYSLRGVLLVPMVVGIVEELASFQFEVEVKMHEVALQGENGAEFTTWRITAIDESQRWKLAPRAEDSAIPDFSSAQIPDRCPYSGKSSTASSSCAVKSHELHLDKETVKVTGKCPYSAVRRCPESANRTCHLDGSTSITHSEAPGMSLKTMQTVFPFHIMVDRSFTILQVGSTLPSLLNMGLGDINGKHISELLDICRPVLGSSWDWRALQKLADQHFLIVPKTSGSLHKRVSMEGNLVKFKACMVEISSNTVMFVLSPDARNVAELNAMELTLSDLPLIGCQRDAVFLGEHIAQEVNKAHDLDKLSKKLRKEKNLSNTLLYNMLPKTVADTLRSGKAVEPKQHDNVTLFFSDIENFTTMCDQIDPMQVIVILNQLYTVMDHLASHFNLYKVETIGDAYMCCSGLPEPDKNHAENIANFAVAVQECVKHVKSPIDDLPISLRIGIHTGSCTAGVVGTLTPHYCLFGDMVNTTARHESTGMAGKIQCSSILYGRLKHFSSYDTDQYTFTPRGLVNMKGKGNCYTYWLEGGTDHNKQANACAIKKLYDQVGDILASSAWEARRYFRRTGDLRDESESETQTEASTRYSSDGDSVDDDLPIPSKSDELSDTVPSSDTDRRVGNIKDGQLSEQDLTGLEDLLTDNEPSANEVDKDSSSSGCIQSQETRDDADVIFLSKDAGILIDFRWSDLNLDENLSHSCLILNIQALLSSLLRLCISDQETLECATGDLCHFVERISNMYCDKSSFHSFRRTCHVIMRSIYLVERAPQLVIDRWNQFAVAFAALIHDIQPVEANNFSIFDKIMGIKPKEKKSCKRQACQRGLDILMDEFPNLYGEIVYGCPRFSHFVRNAVLATDIDSIDKVATAFQKAMGATMNTARVISQRNEATLDLIMVLAEFGHSTQTREIFLHWSKLEYAEREIRREPFNKWLENHQKFLKCHVWPLVQMSELAIQHLDVVKAGAESNFI